MRARNWRWMAAALVVALGASACGGVNLFFGRINNAFFEPTGTVFGWVDSLSRPPELATNPDARFVTGAVYAYFDPAQDVAATDGSNLADLKQEIETHDWLSFQWDKEGDLQNGSTYKAVSLRTTADPIFRVPDPSASDVTAGFSAHVGFRREKVQRNALYSCPTFMPGVVCQSYHPFGSRARIEVTATSVNKAINGQVSLKVKVKIEKVDSDPSDAVTGELNGNITVQVVSERSGEANFDTLELYPLFNVAR